ncbi:Fic family protein [Mycobacterium asiaticum]|uniref:type II toxin-antitoxin system death-on-curing family toxin n=1 Tax=Mycobacterium asiaticum TaxID=1790 RepID=UPI0012DB768E
MQRAVRRCRHASGLGLLESAVLRPQATTFGDDAYPTTHEKAAALLHSLTRNHPFVDGNKRTAWLPPQPSIRSTGTSSPTILTPAEWSNSSFTSQRD